MAETFDKDLLAALDALPLEEACAPLGGDEFDRVLARAQENIRAAGAARRGPAKKGEEPMKKRPFAIAVVAIAACLGLGAAAAGWFLTPHETAQALGYDALAAAFDAPDAITINETQSDAGYDVTLLGLTTAENLTGYWNRSWGELAPGRTYAALAIRASDGTPMAPLDDPGNTFINEGLAVGPLIEGEAPIGCNPMMMNTAWSGTVVDGTYYMVVECDTVAPFADRTVYLMVQQGMFPNFSAYTMDAATGAIRTDPAAVEGINVLFTLPLDASRADPAQAAALLAQWRQPAGDGAVPEEAAPEGDGTMSLTYDDAMDAWTVARDPLAGWTLERVYAEGTLTSSETVPLSDGRIGEGWYFSNGFAVAAAVEHETGAVLNAVAAAPNSDGQASVLVYNEDGTATFEEYALPPA